MAAAAALAALAALTGHARPEYTGLRIGIARAKQQIRFVLAPNSMVDMQEHGGQDKTFSWEGPDTLTLEVVPRTGRLTCLQDSRGGPTGEVLEGAHITVTSLSGQVEELWSPFTVFQKTDGTLAVLEGSAQEGRAYRDVFDVSANSAGMTLINLVDVEDYLRGVVPCEMDPRWPAEALKTQAVAARSYALAAGRRHQAQGFDLCDKAHCQVYGGMAAETAATSAAVEQTKGEVLVRGGSIASAPYSAVCGGFGEGANGDSNNAGRPDFDESNGLKLRRPAGEDQWGAYFRQAPAVNCCQPALCPLDRFRWVVVRRREEIEKSLGDVVNVGTLLALRPLERGPSGRIKRLEVTGTSARSVLSPELVIRNALGGLRSSAFCVESYAGADGVPVVFVFWGAGAGHGLGMCQVGAAGLALKGTEYRQILKKYYPDCEIERRD